MTREEGADDGLDVVLRGTTWLTALAAQGYQDVARSEDITWVQLRDLVLLATTATSTVSMLARQTGVAVSTASRTVERLILAGLVERVGGSEDRRRVELHVTPGGRAMVALLAAHRTAGLRAVVDAMAVEDRDALVRGMAALTAAGNLPAQMG